MSLKDKVILITGASRGIGRALALGFAAKEAIVVTSARTTKAGTSDAPGSLRETVEEIKREGGRAHSFPCDVANEPQVRKLIERTIATVGPVDVVINNAGVNISGTITDLSAKDFDKVLAVNLRGVFLVCKYLIPGMKQRHQGNIINITSRSAIWDTENDLIYGASKAALDRFTVNLSLETKPYNIAVNALGPGLIASTMTRNHDPLLDIWGRSPEPPEVVVPAALWIATQDASTFTGRIVHRDEFQKTWP